MRTKEERAEWKRSKELAKEARAEEKAQKLLDRFGVGSLSHPEDVESIRKIAAELSGTGLMELGSSITLGGGSEKDWARLQAYYLRALVEQAFIMIRQLDRIEKNQK